MSDAARAVFLSYASQDSDAAKRICESLRQAGVEVWFDQSELVGGDAWDQKIRRQIKECALFVPIISANTQARREGYFRFEWRLAVERMQHMDDELAFLVPAVIDGMPEPGALVPEKFRSVQWTRLPDGTSIAAFSERVQMLLNGSSKQTGTAHPRAAIRDEGVAAPVKPAAPKSIAVLAFANLSHDPENEYFSDGISEELLNVLAKVPGLRVTARTSSFYFKGKNLPVPRIAQELGVGYIVEGSVRRAGNRVRITAQLIEAVEDAHLWSETFDRELRDIFAVQDEIAGIIAKNLSLTISALARRDRRVDPEAYRLLLEGRRAASFFSQEGFARAEELFHRALDLDPALESARMDLALLGLDRCVLRKEPARYFADDIAAADVFARNAIQAEPSMGEPHLTLAYVALLRGNMAEASAAIAVALERCPESDHMPLVYNFLQYRLGRPDRVVEMMERACLRDPLAWLPADQLGLSLTFSGRPEKALAPLERAAHLGGPPVVHVNRAFALLKMGRHADAQAEANAALAAAVRHRWDEGFLAFSDGLAAWVLAEAGAREQAAAITSGLVNGPASHRCHAGLPMLAIGEREAGYSLLEEYPQMIVGFLLHCLHEIPALQTDPRTMTLLHRLGAAEAFAALGRSLDRAYSEKSAKC